MALREAASACATLVSATSRKAKNAPAPTATITSMASITRTGESWGSRRVGQPAGSI